MSRPGLLKLHAAASTLGLAIVAAFFASSLYAEVAGDPATLVRVKTGIFYALFALVPCVLVLYRLATRDALDWRFTLVQGVELIAGGTNLVLLGLNLRDGMALRAARSRPRASRRPREGGRVAAGAR